jgi:copper transport protein
MMLLTIISQFILYVSLSLLMGTLILKLIPDALRPSFSIKAPWLYASTIALPIASFVPNIQLLRILAPQFGFLDSLSTVLFKYKVGNAWVAVVILAVLLYFIVSISIKHEKKLASVAGIFLVIAIIFAIAYVSHASTMSAIAGVAFDFIHLLAVSIWLGILLMISFFSTNANNWDAFLKWFSPTALVAFASIALSGVLLTDAIVPAYVTGWASDYGQWLFIKHVLLLPLTFIIVGNGVLIKLKIQKPLFEPRTWVKIEAGLLIAIIAITAIFSEQQPPLSVVQGDNISAVFQFFYGKSIEAGMTAYFQMTGFGLMFFLLTALFIALLIVSYLKETSPIISVSMAIAMALCFYMGFNSITFFS